MKKARASPARAFLRFTPAFTSDRPLLLLPAALPVAGRLVPFDLVGGAELLLQDRLRLLVEVAPSSKNPELVQVVLLHLLGSALVPVAKLAWRVREVLLAVVARRRAGVVP